MKIRQCFVSNSSSSSFIIGLDAFDNVKELAKAFLKYCSREMDDEELYYQEILDRLDDLANLNVDPNTPIMFPTINNNTYIIKREDGFHVESNQTPWSEVIQEVEDTELIENIGQEVFYYNFELNTLVKETEIKCEKENHERYDPIKLVLPSGELVCEECAVDVFKKYAILNEFEIRDYDYEEVSNLTYPTLDQLIEKSFSEKNEILDLSGINIESLPDSIDELQHLKKIIAISCELKSIPESIGNIKNLQEIRLSHNWLESLPSSIQKLKYLEKLILMENNFKSIPDCVFDLPNLKTLSFSMNNLEEYPFEVTNLKALKELYLYRNEIDSIPDDIIHLNQLKVLDLYSNPLKSISDNIYELEKLELLNIGRCKLEDLPLEIGKLKNLKCLVLRYNDLDDLPDTLKELSHLEMLDLSRNNLTELPDWIGNINSLVDLNLEGNKIKHLTKSLKDLMNLKKLYVVVYGIDDESKKLIQELKKRGVLIIEYY